VVFHDAYQHFEQRYGLTPQAIVTVQGDRKTGAKRIAAIRKAIVEQGVDCVFTEPQFPPKLVATLSEGTDVYVGMLDPIGADIPAGPEVWFTLLTRLADEFVACAP
jgi:zinc transport system substrate-binding protein